MRRDGRFAVFGIPVPGRLPTGGRLGKLTLGVLLLLSSRAHAHAPDTSYLRAVVEKHALELRFTFDIATLYKIERLDKDGDGKVTRAEAEAVAPDIAKFLRRAITLELNGEKGELGAFQQVGWPVDAGDAVEEKNYGQTLLHFTFRQETPRLIEDVYVLYELYGQLGAVHRTVANIEQDGKNQEVVFNQFEPDYLYDTFWRPETEGQAPSPPEAGASDGGAWKNSFRAGVAYTWNFVDLLWGVAMTVTLLVCFFPRRASLVVFNLAVLASLLLDKEPHRAVDSPQLYLLGVLVGLLTLAAVAWPVGTLCGQLWRMARSARAGREA